MILVCRTSRPDSTSVFPGNSQRKVPTPKQQSESDTSNDLWNTLFHDICALMFTFPELLSLTVVWRLRHADPSNDASIKQIKPEWRYRKGCSRFTVL